MGKRQCLGSEDYHCMDTAQAPGMHHCCLQTLYVSLGNRAIHIPSLAMILGNAKSPVSGNVSSLAPLVVGWTDVASLRRRHYATDDDRRDPATAPAILKIEPKLAASPPHSESDQMVTFAAAAGAVDVWKPYGVRMTKCMSSTPGRST